MPDTTRSPDDFVTVTDCYKQLRIGRRQMYDMLKNGDGPRHRRFGTRIRIRYKDFMAWATKPNKKEK